MDGRAHKMHDRADPQDGEDDDGHDPKYPSSTRAASRRRSGRHGQGDRDGSGRHRGGQIAYQFGGRLIALIGMLGHELADDRPHIERHLRPHLLKDLGTWHVAWSCIWAYLAYTQYIIIYFANTNDESWFYLMRLQHGYQYGIVLEILLRFPLPFAILLSQRQRTNPRALAWAAGLVCLVSPAPIGTAHVTGTVTLDGLKRTSASSTPWVVPLGGVVLPAGKVQRTPAPLRPNTTEPDFAVAYDPVYSARSTTTLAPPSQSQACRWGYSLLTSLSRTSLAPPSSPSSLPLH